MERVPVATAEVFPLAEGSGILESGTLVPMSLAESFAALAVVSPGLEAPTAAELTGLGAQAVQPLRGAVAFRSDMAVFYRLHLRARLPFRLLRELARFPCSDKEELRHGVAQAADWTVWLPPERSLRVELSGATENQALSALLFLYRKLLEWDLELEGVVRAR